jgi:hypothetical protein
LEEKHIDLLIDEYADFTIQRDLNPEKEEKIAELLGVNKMEELILRKGNLSLPGLDSITFPLFKYDKGKVAKLC